MPKIRGRNGSPVIGARLEPVHRVELGQNLGQRPPNTNAGSSLSPSFQTQGFGGLQFADRFLVTAGLGTNILLHDSGTSFFLRLQSQLLGDSGENIKPQNVSGSLTLEYQNFSRTQSGDQQVEFGNGGYPWKAQGQTKTYMGSWSMGYRTTLSSMYFASVGFGEGTSNGNVDQSISNDGTSSGGSYSIPSRSFKVTSVGIGVVLGSGRHSFVPKLVYSEMRDESKVTSLGYVYFEWKFNLYTKEDEAKKSTPLPVID